MVEGFDNGARPYLKLRFVAGRPDEVEVYVFAENSDAGMSQCIITATAALITAQHGCQT